MLIITVILGIITFLLYGIFIKPFLNFKQRVRVFPGRKDNFFFGDVLNFSREADILWDQLRERNKEFPEGWRLFALNEAAINLNTPEDAEIILSSMKYIKKSLIYNFLKPWLKTGLLTSEGSQWQHRRKLLTTSFHFNILRRFVDIFGEHGKDAIEKLKTESKKDKTNIIPFISKLTLSIICETAMGVTMHSDNNDQLEYREAIDRKVIEERERTFQESDLDKLDKEEEETNVYMKNKKRFAMLDLLISAKRKGEIDDEGIREEVDTFMFEGHDTTSMAISFALLRIANHKDVQEKVRAEMDEIFKGSDRSATYQDLQNMQYLEMVLKECMRLHPSVPFISRQAEEDIPLRGRIIPKGCMVHVHIYDIHRNPKVFPDPEKFEPDRFLPENSASRHPYAYIPFSAGARNCIGQKFAMLEMKSVISSVLRYYELEPVTTLQDIRILVHLVLRPKDPIYVKFKARS